MNLKTETSAFGMISRRGVKSENNPGMKARLAAETPCVTIVGKTSDHQLPAEG